jgi:hypothetical protein
MRWLILIVLSLLTLFGVMYLIGSFLPVGHVSTVKRKLPVTPMQLWNLLVDYQNYKSWRSDLKSVTPINHKRWKEESKHGDIIYEHEVVEEHKVLVSRIASEDLPFGGYWTFQLNETADGTELLITENGQVYNPFFRFMSKFLFGHDSTLQQYMDDLEDHLKKQ